MLRVLGRHMLLSWLFVAVCLPTLCSGLLEGIYCGVQDCYDVLGVTRVSTKAEIGKAYRLLARKYHPDMHRGDEAKTEAEIQFKLIATAYEILKEDDSRTDYDYMLDHPDEYYANYYRYFRRRMAPKVDVRIVIVATLTIISIIQYYTGWQRYEDAIKYFATVPKYRNAALEIAKNEINDKIHSRSKGKLRISKTDQRDELERIVRRVVAEKMDVKGAYAKPKLWDLLWIQLLICPYTLLCYIIWYGKWIWRFSLLHQPFGEEEKLYLIRKNMKMGQHQFDALEEDLIEEYLHCELWKKDKFEIWKAEQDEEMKKKQAENPRYKSYRRYMKNHGPGRMTFED